MLHVLFDAFAPDDYVIQVNKYELEAAEYTDDVSLEIVSGVFNTERRANEFEKAES